MVAITQYLPTREPNAAISHFSADQLTQRILLVDSQAHVLRVMKSTLDRSGYEVETAMSAEIALGKMRESHFDVVIVDNGLDKLDGQQLINTIGDQFHECVPAMFLVTDSNLDKLQQWCTQFDKTECLEKPISISYLASRLDELVFD